MEKVLLVSFIGTKNFGNRLQQYALQRTIEGLGFKVDILQKGEPRLKALAKKILKRGYIISHNKRFEATEKRTNKFLNRKEIFYKNLIYISDNKVFRTSWDIYKWVVAGSDQIWHNGSHYYYLEFIEESKRISYAPSFGFSSFPEKAIDEHRRGLMGMHALSCREQEGCDLIYGLTGRIAQKVLDPTLLLTRNEWTEIESKPIFRIPEKYMLVDFLGMLLPEYEKEIHRIADERSLQIINVNDYNDVEHYAISPDEFLWLVHHADTICTDSFHATVFSILYEKNLRVFRRRQERFNDMFGRLHDLLDPLGLMNLVYGEGEGLSTVLNEQAKMYLDSEREASLQYLKKNLCVE